MSELFPIESVASPSPRLAWFKKHGIKTWSLTQDERVNDDEKWWAAQFTNGTRTRGSCKCGRTEDEAIFNVCKYLGIKLWNEETHE